jgi:hypothetical protein
MMNNPVIDIPKEVVTCDCLPDCLATEPARPAAVSSSRRHVCPPPSSSSVAADQTFNATYLLITIFLINKPFSSDRYPHPIRCLPVLPACCLPRFLKVPCPLCSVGATDIIYCYPSRQPLIINVAVNIPHIQFALCCCREARCLLRLASSL